VNAESKFENSRFFRARSRSFVAQHRGGIKFISAP
jgi:hypothetical protein